MPSQRPTLVVPEAKSQPLPVVRPVSGPPTTGGELKSTSSPSESTSPAPEPHPTDSVATALGTEPAPEAAPHLDSVTALAPFYAALAASEASAETMPDAVVRVLHMGDSSIGLDGLPHALRSRMQQRFGDAGPGFVFVDRFSRNYDTQVANLNAAGWDICYIAYLCQKDGHYGLGGHIFRSTGTAWSQIGPPRRGRFGRDVSRIELWYAASPRGGLLRLRVDRDAPQTVDTNAPTLVDRWHEVHVDRGEHTIELRSGGNGRARVYGIVLENEGPGVVWDTVSMSGAMVRRLHGYDDHHIASQVAHRDPNLLVLNYGGNDLRRFVTRSVTPAAYKEEYRTVVRKLRAGKPGLACLVVGIIDHGRSGPYDVEPRHTAAMVAVQREVAAEEGCAFFDSVAAMGGLGSVHRWLSQRPRLVEPDLKHLNRRGRDHMGGLIYAALLSGYAGPSAPDDDASPGA